VRRELGDLQAARSKQVSRQASKVAQLMKTLNAAPASTGQLHKLQADARRLKKAVLRKIAADELNSKTHAPTHSPTHGPTDAPTRSPLHNLIQKFDQGAVRRRLERKVKMELKHQLNKEVKKIEHKAQRKMRRKRSTTPMAVQKLGTRSNTQLTHLKVRSVPCSTIDLSHVNLAVPREINACPAGQALTGLRSTSIHLAALRSIGVARCCSPPAEADVKGACSVTASKANGWVLCPLGQYLVGIGTDGDRARCCGGQAQVGQCRKIAISGAGMTQCPTNMLLAGIHKHHTSKLDSADELMCCEPKDPTSTFQQQTTYIVRAP
jgi:hypothetical protein